MSDLQQVWEYIAKDSAYYADAFVRRARDVARSLNELANRGRIVPEFGVDSIRQILVKRYRLIYRVTDETVDILAFIHGARDLGTFWEQEDRPRK